MAEEFGLSDREKEILELLAGGVGNKEIAARLVISSNTVKVHLRNIYAKLGVSSRTEAVMFAIRNHLVLVDGIDVESETWGRDSKGVVPLLGLNRLRGREQSWYLTLGLVSLLFISITAMLFLIMGGGNGPGIFGSTNTEIETQRWRLLPDLPHARKGLAVTSFENQIYVIGGETKKDVSGLVERFDPRTETWERLADKPVPVTDVQAVAIGGLIYVPGGRMETGETTDGFEVFNPRTEQWQALAPLPRPLSAYAAVAFEGRMYLFGGWDGENYVDAVFWYDPQANVWTEGSAMQIGRGYARAEVAGGVIYVVGGLNESGSLDLNEVYYPQRENTGEAPWQIRAPMPEPRYAFGLTNVADILHIVGGVGESDALSPLKYSPQSDTWQDFSQSRQDSWSYMGMTSIEGFLYVLGGQRGDKISAENTAYQAIYTITLPLVQ